MSLSADVQTQALPQRPSSSAGWGENSGSEGDSRPINPINASPNNPDPLSQPSPSFSLYTLQSTSLSPNATASMLPLAATSQSLMGNSTTFLDTPAGTTTLPSSSRSDTVVGMGHPPSAPFRVVVPSLVLPILCIVIVALVLFVTEWVSSSHHVQQISVFAGVVVVCAGFAAVLTHLFVTLPCRQMQAQLRLLKDALRFPHSFETLDLASIRFSRFSEIAKLQLLIVDVLKISMDSNGHRAKEAFRASIFENAHAELQNLMRAKELFFAMMSHELRTPLNAIIGMSEILSETTLTTEQKECVDGIVFSGGVMLTLVNNILDYSKLEAEKLVLESVSYSLRLCIEKVVQAVQLKAEEKNLELIVDIGSDIPPESLGDPSRLSQVLLNLLSNAIKFTRKGYVLIRCSVVHSTGGIHFLIQDTGIGLSSEAMSRLFQPFVQADSSTSRQFGGTGLGLVIAQKIIEKMGSKIEVESEGEGHGCVFEFTLHTSTRERRKSLLRTSFSLPANQHFHSFSDLLVSPLNMLPTDSSFASPVMILDNLAPRRRALSELFQALQITSHRLPALSDVFRSGEHQLNVSSSPLAIVIYLPDIQEDFAGVLNELREIGKSDVRPQGLIFITNMKPSSAVRLPPKFSTMKAVCINKPVTLEKLKNAMTKITDPESKTNLPKPKIKTTMVSSASTSSLGLEFPTSPTRCSPLLPETVSMVYLGTKSPTAQTFKLDAHLLVIDDVVLNQRVLAMKLQQRGFQHIEVASSGLEALEKIRELRANQAATRFDLILTDVLMPECNGYETTRRIKAIAGYEMIPIIGITGDCSAECLAECEAAGMVAVLGKPIETEALFSTLHQYLGV